MVFCNKSTTFLTCHDDEAFPIHELTGDATTKWRQNPTRTRTFQSTHPLGVRQVRLYRQFHHLAISIHAPTRGATAPYLSPCLTSNWKRYSANLVKASVFKDSFYQNNLKTLVPQGVRIPREFHVSLGFAPAYTKHAADEESLYRSDSTYHYVVPNQYEVR